MKGQNVCGHLSSMASLISFCDVFSITASRKQSAPTYLDQEIDDGLEIFDIRIVERIDAPRALEFPDTIPQSFDRVMVGEVGAEHVANSIRRSHNESYSVMNGI